MSRIGKQPVALPEGIRVTLEETRVKVQGPNGQLEVPVHPLAEVRQEGSALCVSSRRPSDRKSRAIWGLTRSLLANAVEGATKGFEKRLVVVGIGYRADVKGKNLELQVGYSHAVVIEPEVGVEFRIEAAPSGLEGAQASIVVSGADKALVGRVAADIRKVRPPEPYKGKGIRYDGELVRRKVGKAAVT